MSWATESDAFLAQFHLEGLIAAMAIHIFTSVLVGLLYGAMLPMFPRRPIITCGFVAPFLWTGITFIHFWACSAPILDQRISWGWFFISQVAFGLVAGYVVNPQGRCVPEQFRALPFAVRAGLHTDQSGRRSASKEGATLDEKNWIATRRASRRRRAGGPGLRTPSACKPWPSNRRSRVPTRRARLRCPAKAELSRLPRQQQRTGGGPLSFANPAYLAVAVET